MPLKKAAGNMYDWCTHTHTHLRGACPHACSYCYVQALSRRFPAMRANYTGPVRLDEAELAVNYGHGRTIFIEHLHDLFADTTPSQLINLVLDHLNRYPDNTYILQTKNPARVAAWEISIPPRVVIGTTAETDSPPIGLYTGMAPRAPTPLERLDAMRGLNATTYFQTFVTVEPILMMKDPEDFADRIAAARPSFVNIGADSKGRGLPEPDAGQIIRLINALTRRGVAIRRKTNLARLLTPKEPQPCRTP